MEKTQLFLAELFATNFLLRYGSTNRQFASVRRLINYLFFIPSHPSQTSSLPISSESELTAAREICKSYTKRSSFYILWGVGVLLGPFKNCVSLSSIRGDWSSFQLAISMHRLDLICNGIAPSAKMMLHGRLEWEIYGGTPSVFACGAYKIITRII